MPRRAKTVSGCFLLFLLHKALVLLFNAHAKVRACAPNVVRCPKAPGSLEAQPAICAGTRSQRQNPSAWLQYVLTWLRPNGDQASLPETLQKASIPRLESKTPRAEFFEGCLNIHRYFFPSTEAEMPLTPDPAPYLDARQAPMSRRWLADNGCARLLPGLTQPANALRRLRLWLPNAPGIPLWLAYHAGAASPPVQSTRQKQHCLLPELRFVTGFAFFCLTPIRYSNGISPQSPVGSGVAAGIACCGCRRRIRPGKARISSTRSSSAAPR